MAKRESKFLTELKNSLTPNGVFFHKIKDMPHMGGMRFDSKKPFDAFGVFQDCLFPYPFAIEAKSIRRGSFNFKSIRENQIEGLSDYQKCGGNSFIFLNVRDSNFRLNRLYIFGWHQITNAMFRGRKSFLWKELETMPFIEGKGGLFDAVRIKKILAH